MVHDVWVEVDLAALRHNLCQVRSILPENTKLMAVVKGNGFGHGYVEPSRAFAEAGADALAVTRIEEALPIRAAGIRTPILLFAPIQPQNAGTALEADLEMTVASTELARAISDAACSLGKTARVHVKVDTGMGRLGLLPGQVLPFFRDINSLPGIEVAGIYTHFAGATEKDIAPSQQQLAAFNSVLNELKSAGIGYGLAHAANSAATLRLPQSHMDMVRPGTLLYGQYPSANTPHSLDLKPTWKLKARVCEVRDVPAGSRISYGGEHITGRPTRTAIIPIGYADGFTLVPEGPVYRQGPFGFFARKMKRSLRVDIRGVKAPVIGRVAMQMIVVDVTGISRVCVGDESIIPAMRIPTSALVPRVYVDPQ